MDYKKHLQENILGFWLKNAVDNTHGGIYSYLERDGSLYGTDKSVWFQGRALWVFSKAYNCIEKKDEYLKFCKSIFDFLPKCIDNDGRMFFTVTEDGRSIQKRRYFFSETFAAIGCAEYFKATKNLKAWKMAEQFFDTMYKLYTNPHLIEAKYNPETHGLKGLSPVMIVLSTAQVMRSVGINTSKYETVIKSAIGEILYGGFFRKESGILLESVSLNGDFVDSPSGRVVNPGHALEAAWFLMAEGIIQNDTELNSYAKQIINASMSVGVDKDNGGILSFMDINKRPPLQLEWDMKLWWPQNEAIIANALAFHVFKDVEYRNNHLDIESYAFKYFADDEYGEWYGYLHYDNTVSNTLKGNMFKGLFHLPRMLMFLICLNEDRLSEFLM